jgi:hypothetical protein
MKQIDEFVNSIYDNVSGNEAKELKEEMRSHLLEAVADLKEEGKSEREAIIIAISRFGDGEQITKGLFSLFKAHNQVVKNLFRTAIISLMIGLGIFIALIVRDLVISNEQLNVQEALSIIDNLNGKELSEIEKDRIISNFKEVTNDKLVYLSLYKKLDGMPESIPGNEFPQVYSEMDQVLVFGSSYKMNYGYENKNWYSEVGYNGSPYLGTFYAIPYSLFIIFAILGLIAFILKQNTQRKMLQVFLKD